LAGAGVLEAFATAVLPLWAAESDIGVKLAERRGIGKRRFAERGDFG
jgi:hypothetical protein